MRDEETRESQVMATSIESRLKKLRTVSSSSRRLARVQGSHVAGALGADRTGLQARGNGTVPPALVVWRWAW